jgi:nucleoside-diphosphate-sugar epimerase
VRILLTGARGFIGQWVVKTLEAKNHSVIAFSGDVRDRNTFPLVSVDIVVHLAAIVDKRFWKSDNLFDVNVKGTQNLIEHYQDAKIVFISSTDVEKDILTDYARTKKEAESLVMLNPGNLVIRPPSVFGLGDTHDKLIPRLFKKHLEGQECIITNNNENEYIHVRKAAQFIVDNMDERGIKRLAGFKIRNQNLDKMVRAVCKGEKILTLSHKEQKFFTSLKECLPVKESRYAK